jgi:cytochrome o ubiquinol oxidase subunit 2
MAGKRRKILTPFRVIAASTLILALIIFGGWLLLQGKDIPVLNPQGVVGRNEKDLILFTLMLSVIVVVPVFTLLGLFAWRYREGNKKAVYRPDEDGNKWLEALWWGIPIVIIGILGTVTWVSTHQLDPYKPLDSNVKPLNVEVVALQWRWLFLYPDQGVATINELKIPAGTPINFQITADAPMSAFWIPALGTQTYAMTGMSAKLSLEADRPGTYRGTNSNINGKGYANMDFAVNAMKPSDFTAWAASIPGNPKHSHLEWDEYVDLAKQSTDEKVEYFHLHDISLYKEVVAKYNSSGSMGTQTMSHDHGGDDE